MKSSLFYPLFLSVAALSGCSPNHLIQTTDSQGASVCKLYSAPVTSVQNLYLYGATLGLKKIDNNTLLAWIIFSPTDSRKTPLERPGVILKFYKNKKIVDEVRINDGRAHHYQDHFVLGVTDSDISPLKKEKINISKEFWNFPLQYHFYTSLVGMNVMAVSFSLPQEVFHRILNSDHVEFLIQSHSDPIIASVEKDEFLPFIEFKKSCL